jgi:hypothetical protein
LKIIIARDSPAGRRSEPIAGAATAKKLDPGGFAALEETDDDGI